MCYSGGEFMELICTIGPRAKSFDDIKSYIDNGMTIPRFNFSHADYEKFDLFLKELKTLNNIKYIMQDLQGNKLRVSKKFKGEYKVSRGSKIAFCLEKDFEDLYLRKMNQVLVPVCYEGSFNDFKNVKHIYMKDATMKFKVLRFKENFISTVTIQGGILRAEKGINAPNLNRSSLTLTAKDKKDIEWGITRGINMISLSYTSKGEDIKEVRSFINEMKHKYEIKDKIKLYSKIECKEGYDNFEDILKLSDGIILGRGDLKGEVEITKIPIIEEAIIKRMKKSRKNLFIATYLLDTMSRFSSPSIGEINDIYRFINSKVNGLVLCTELAISRRPEKIVKALKEYINLYSLPQGNFTHL